MKLSTSWIKNHLRRTIFDREIVDALERAGLEIEQFSSSKLLDSKIVVGRITKVASHPDADRLHVVQVESGSGELEIVCGAPNVRVGLVAPLAQIGATLPSGDVISKAKLRGVSSNGMLCSGLELGLSDDHDGLLELDEKFAPGTPLSELYPADGLIDVSTHANRFDLLSVVGLAREVAAMTGNELVEPTATELKFDSTDAFIADLEPSTQRFMVSHLSLDSSANTPEWMVLRLASAGIRSLGIVVDVTNYAMLEYGQPLHAYDADKLTLPFATRQANTGETLITLDGRSRKLSPSDIVVTADDKAVGLAGVMGGQETEVTTTTKAIYLEAATFKPAGVRKTAQRHTLRSEASARFERGLPTTVASIGLALAVQLLRDHAQAKVLNTADKLTVWPWQQRLGIRASYASRQLGVKLTREEIARQLDRLGIEAQPFDIAVEAKRHLGKPYKWAASFKTDGIEAFDCSYLTDYIYSLIAQPIGHTAHEQFKTGQPVELEELRPGDLVFRGGPFVKLSEAEREGVSHVGLYVGDGKIVHAIDIERRGEDWTDRSDKSVQLESLEVITKDPAYLGARRYVDDASDWVSVRVAPWWRPDLKLEEDLIEELARLVGYDSIPSTIPPWHPQTVSFDRKRRPEQMLRDALSGLGLFEVMTYSFVAEDQIIQLGGVTDDYLKLKNPLSSEQAYLRRSLLPSHLMVLGRNRTYASEVGFYEISGVFHKTAKGAQPNEPRLLAITLLRRNSSYTVLKGIWDALEQRYGLNATISPSDDHKEYLAGRGAEVVLGKSKLGKIGQLKPNLVRQMKLSGEVAYLEIDLALFLASARPVRYRPPSRFPSAGRDLTVLVPNEASWQSVSSALAAVNGLAVTYRGDYHGPELPAGHRSISMHLQFSATDHTLSDDEVREREQRVMSILERKVGAKPRS